MSFELHCPSCVRSFTGPSDSKTAEFLDRMTANGSWCPLGDGETIEDNVSTALAAEDDLGCPQCGEPMIISQESLNRLARELLVQW